MTKKNTGRAKTVSQQTSFTLKDKTAKAKSRRKLQRRAKSMARDAQGRFVGVSRFVPGWENSPGVTTKHTLKRDMDMFEDLVRDLAQLSSSVFPRGQRR